MEDKQNPYEVALVEMFTKAEEQIIAEIARKEKKGYVTYGEKAALSRIKQILNQLTTEAVPLIPKLVEMAFFHGAVLSVGTRKAKQTIGVNSNRKRIDLLTKNLTGELSDATQFVGRRINDSWRKATLEAVAQKEAIGMNSRVAGNLFRETILDERIVAFKAENGAQWSLARYTAMAVRSVAREAANTGVLFADPDHDLYMISSHASSCPICAPLEGRIYSRSGLSSEFPSLSVAFSSRKNKDGPDTLENSYLNIHPNCRHVLLKVTEENYRPEEWEKLKKFSNRSFDDDPRSKKDVENYRKSQEVRRKLREDFDQFRRYKLRMGDGIPKTFQTFQRVKYQDPDRFAHWQENYKAFREEV